MSNVVSKQCDPQVQKLMQHYGSQLRARAAGSQGGTAVNWYEIFTKFIASVTQLVQSIAANPADKRQAVIDAALAFWKQQVEPILAQQINMPWVFNAFIEPTIEKEIPVVAGGLYDALLSVFNRFVNPQPPAPNPGPGPVSPSGPVTPGGFQPY